MLNNMRCSFYVQILLNHIGIENTELIAFAAKQHNLFAFMFKFGTYKYRFSNHIGIENTDAGMR